MRRCLACALLFSFGCVVDRAGLALDADASTPSDGGAPRDGAIGPRDATPPDAPSTPDAGVDGGVDAGVDAGPPIPSDWFDPAWGERRRLTFDNAPHAEDLVDFPVLLVLDASRVDYERAGPAAEQLRFVDPDGTALSFEIEVWQPGGTSYVWLRVPRIDASSATDHVWMYTDNPGAPDGQDAAGTWSDAYRGVWHMSGGFDDATGFGNDGAGSAATDAEGRIGGAKRFGRDQPSVVADDPSLDLTSAVTISAWMYPTSLAHPLAVLSKRESCESEANYAVFIRGDDAIQFEHHDASWRTFRQGALAEDRWQWVVATFDTSTDRVALYQDGVPTGAPMTNDRSLLADANAIEIGRNGGCGGDYMEGPLDEVRLEAVARSETWIAAEYRAMTDDYVDYGPRETIR
ncbi:MAG: DUF2341 domain-containing protein [Sandaracinus sp.]|nr:DUF2341 domain-containing protein [Sandaracinus sp.]